LVTESRTEKFRATIHAFIRNFGLLDQTRTPCGLPIPVSDAHALMELLKTPGIGQTELSRRLGLSKSATSRLLRRLIRRGQVTRVNRVDDGRAYSLQLTGKGKRQARMINRESLATFRAVMSGLSEEAAEQLLRYFPLLVKALPGPARKLDSIGQCQKGKHLLE